MIRCKIVYSTDGKLKIAIAAENEENTYEIEASKNPFQSRSVVADREVLIWLRNAINEHLAAGD